MIFSFKWKHFIEGSLTVYVSTLWGDSYKFYFENYIGNLSRKKILSLLDNHIGMQDIKSITAEALLSDERKFVLRLA